MVSFAAANLNCRHAIQPDIHYQGNNVQRLNILNPFQVWTAYALKTSEMLLASAQVIGHRSARIAAAGAIPNARDRREFTLMGQEKVEAAAESAFAIGMRMMAVNQQIGTMLLKQWIQGSGRAFALAMQPALVLSGRRQAQLLRTAMLNSGALAAKLGNSAAQTAQHGLKPIHARATANARRLRKI